MLANTSLPRLLPADESFLALSDKATNVEDSKEGDLKTAESAPLLLLARVSRVGGRLLVSSPHYQGRNSELSL